MEPTSREELVAAIKGALAPVFEKMADKIVAAYLFGSIANGRIGPASDIDIAVLLTGVGREGGGEIRASLYADFCRNLKRNDVDVVILNSARNLFLKDEVVRHGVLLYDRDPAYRQEFEVSVMHDFIDFRDHRKRVMGV